jgi:hypothetical protein
MPHAILRFRERFQEENHQKEIYLSIINDKVFIDNKEVPPNVTRYKSPRTGTVYRIQRKGGAVSVSEEGSGK